MLLKISKAKVPLEKSLSEKYLCQSGRKCKEKFWQRIHVGMDEMYQVVYQATHRFFGIDETFNKLVMDEIYEIV